MSHDEYVAAKRALVAELQESEDRIVLLQRAGGAKADNLEAELRECASETHRKIDALNGVLARAQG